MAEAKSGPKNSPTQKSGNQHDTFIKRGGYQPRGPKPQKPSGPTKHS